MWFKSLANYQGLHELNLTYQKRKKTLHSKKWWPVVLALVCILQRGCMEAFCWLAIYGIMWCEGSVWVSDTNKIKLGRLIRRVIKLKLLLLSLTAIHSMKYRNLTIRWYFLNPSCVCTCAYVCTHVCFLREMTAPRHVLLDFMELTAHLPVTAIIKPPVLPLMAPVFAKKVQSISLSLSHSPSRS